LRLRLHDDGTLTAGDRERLCMTLSEPELVPLEEDDARAAELLTRRPALAAYRRSNPIGRKLLDVVLAAGAELAYCDADVLFLRPFVGLFDRSTPEAGAVFMSDLQEAYSVRSWQLLIHRRLRLPRRVNSGIIGFDTRSFDPDLLEWYLSHPEFGFAPVWVEQTGWALLGSQAGCRLIDPDQIALPAGPPRAVTGEGPLALHFVSPLRSLLPAYLAMAEAPAPSGTLPVLVRTVPARRCTAAHLAGSELRRWLAR
jgi:hypothetical protein